MDIEHFVTTRSAVWARLEELLGKAEISPDRRPLPLPEVQELVQLYRRACSDLNLARSYTANPEILDRLNQLTGRAYRFVYRAGHETSVWASFVRLVGTEIPSAFRRQQLYVAIAAAAFLLGTLFGAIAIIVDPANGPRLVPREFFTERPRERVAKIERNEERIDSVEKAALFGASLYTHNIQVSFLAFSLGALTILGGIWLLFYNGVIFGAIMTLYVLDGVPMFFFAWVGPHGALELPSIIFGGAAGFLAGRALLMPGNLTRGASLRRVLPSVWRMMTGTMLTLVLAGIIEGSFSQFSQKTLPYPLKIGVAILLFTALMVYLFARKLDANVEE
ncbi:MAG TPA: stage II sporulation protein M [Thermoanaerobaculia bacterium]|nr:stage II sporulation protein M [Thermoanaerobaculia bacterium]